MYKGTGLKFKGWLVVIRQFLCLSVVCLDYDIHYLLFNHDLKSPFIGISMVSVQANVDRHRPPKGPSAMAQLVVVRLLVQNYFAPLALRWAAEPTSSEPRWDPSQPVETSGDIQYPLLRHLIDELAPAWSVWGLCHLLISRYAYSSMTGIQMPRATI